MLVTVLSHASRFESTEMEEVTLDSALASARIVLAEDGEDDRALAFRALRRCQVPLVVQVASDGQRVLDLLLGDLEEVPELILLDIKMPLISGIDVLARLRDETRYNEVPIVMLTSSDEPSDIQRSRGLGASSYVRKPVDYEEYLQVLREVADFWLLRPGQSSAPPHCLLTTAANA